MDGKQLKNSILQWAIQGKLVPQNPKDEPASKLLERIAESRNESSLSLPKGTAKGTKSKDPGRKKSAQSSRIYRENGVWYEQVGTATPKDISDEIPFEIPKNWTWCRLKDYLDVRDGTHDSPKYYSSGIPFVTSKNLVNGQIDFSNVKYISQEDHEAFSARSKVDDNDILFAMIGSIGNPVLVKKTCDFSIKNVALFKPYNEETDMHYMLLYFQHIQTGLKKIAAGGVQSFISLNVFRNWLFPLPPLAEQKRIVAKLEQVLPLAEEYGAAQEQLDKLNKELPEALKKSILQEAIQGKLVPQNSKDEPAHKLLERITAARSEANQPKGAKSKKSTPTSRIYCENGTWYEQIGSATPKDISDEIPFEIPESWAWCRLGNCSDYAASKEKAKSFKDIQEMWSLDLEDIEKNSGRIVKRLKVSERKIVGEKVIFKKGQVLYSKLRPYLKKILVAPEDGVCSSEIVPFSPFECLDASYLVTVLKSPHVDYTINLVTYGVKMPRVGTDTMLNLLIPIPPLAEQKRIVAKLEQLFKVL
ncbi:type I restriction enzyme, S subunit [Fibrobacter sp. UWT2]|uniref:restriction endonuclease subunit S n=1 Tax=Fibrobacter sp. UWT2 TaxID=1896224 RepID=UPI00091F86C3|nr:restriction endonuclease subunit S [Fibrobacter sp. UWT2]SHK59003.1 type I restriction enzyme, S subunit [Fibrobacter sp. UWT2]